MIRSVRRIVPALAAFFASTAFVRAAFAEGHTVAAVDPDEQLARALDIALSPWGATIDDVRVDHPGSSTGMSVDRARTIAREAHADVVMWVATDREGHAAVWIYDAASDQASLRDLSSPPPFDATTAAAVALSVKALLRFTVVAPPRERFGAEPPEPTWSIGLGESLALHQTDPLPNDVSAEARTELFGTFWPPFLAHQIGIMAGVSLGTRTQFITNTPMLSHFEGTLNDYSARLMTVVRLPLMRDLALEPALGVSVHWFVLDYTLVPLEQEGAGSQTVDHRAIGVDEQLAASFTVLGGYIQLAPWVGLTVLTDRHRFEPQAEPGAVVADTGAFIAEFGVRAGLMLP